jgi:hypothetical protein
MFLEKQTMGIKYTLNSMNLTNLKFSTLFYMIEFWTLSPYSEVESESSESESMPSISSNALVPSVCLSRSFLLHLVKS